MNRSTPHVILKTNRFLHFIGIINYGVFKNGQQGCSL
uniref:Uncharacterized protein n=1 Tax=Rhizophora mucronata TaxID=61149 RepID=A0A2P2IYQ5_RHIMU